MVHFHDMPILENMWQEAQSVSNRLKAGAYAPHAPPFEVPPQDDGLSTKTIRFSRYHFHTAISIAKERNGEEVSSDAYPPLEITSSGGASTGCFPHPVAPSFPHPFGPDPLFEDGGATEEFGGEAAGGLLREKGSMGKDGAPDVAWNKTKEAGRKYISCHYVPAHAQVPVLVEGRKGGLMYIYIYIYREREREIEIKRERNPRYLSTASTY